MTSVEVAGPGFVNFHLDVGWLQDALAELLEQGEDRYARPDVGHGERVQVEFISANPTGPIHVGNGWWGSYGDALARILARAGYRVSREYYVNDTGGQIRTLGESVLARRRGDEVPEGGYQGEYVTELAGEYDGPDDVDRRRQMGGRPDPRSHPDDARVDRDLLRRVVQPGVDRGERSGRRDHRPARGEGTGVRAVTVRPGSAPPSSATVATGSSASPTATRPTLPVTSPTTDDKFLVRGYDRVIDVFGADHHGQMASLFAGVAALGVDPVRLEVKLGQMVSLVDGDEAVKMGKRAGNAISLDSLIADIGPDATRILSLMSSLDQATTFDLALVREQSIENPVFYVQMASARIGGVARKAAERGIVRAPLQDVDLSLLTHERELDLIRCLEELPEVVAEAARRPGSDQGDRLGAPSRHQLPRLLSRLPDPLAGRRGARAPGAPLAGRGNPDRSGHRARPPRGRLRRSRCDRRDPTGPVRAPAPADDRGRRL